MRRPRVREGVGLSRRADAQERCRARGRGRRRGARRPRQVPVTWVGLARWRRVLVCAYPKYYPRPSDEFPHPPEAELAQVFRVLCKSSGGLAGIGAALPDADEDGGPLSLMLALLGSYEENGVYTNYVRVIRDNGSGEIAWDRTIAQNQPFMDRDTPVYFDLKTRDTSRDAADLVTRLHRCVLTRCSADLRRWGVDELLELAEVDLSGEELEDLGEPETLTHHLEQERSVQFVTWKQDVIDMLLRYLNPSEEYESPEEEFCLGTSSFYTRGNWHARPLSGTGSPTA